MGGVGLVTPPRGTKLGLLGEAVAAGLVAKVTAALGGVPRPAAAVGVAVVEVDADGGVIRVGTGVPMGGDTLVTDDAEARPVVSP
jgi:hypothetical protein